MDAWKQLKALVKNEKRVLLVDFDGYDHVGLGADLFRVVNDFRRKMGHAFVLAMILEGLLKDGKDSEILTHPWGGKLAF